MGCEKHGKRALSEPRIVSMLTRDVGTHVHIRLVVCLLRYDTMQHSSFILHSANFEVPRVDSQNLFPDTSFQDFYSIGPCNIEPAKRSDV